LVCRAWPNFRNPAVRASFPRSQLGQKSTPQLSVALGPAGVWKRTFVRPKVSGQALGGVHLCNASMP
ncbi:MAG TPA: hypothetical protein VN764_17980, partial [Polyangiaceae bacterium]|nr:hypothetical protein [Polyangiaceae bacterium]